MTFTPTTWSILETAREKPHILLRPDQIGPARLLESGGFLRLHQSADWWMMAALTDAGREALTTRRHLTRCGECGGKRVDVRPNRKEQPAQPSLTGKMFS